MSQQYFGEHLSLSQWAMQANVGAQEALIQEDGSKRTRLGFLNTAMGLPVVSNAVFTYADMLTPSETFASFRERADSLPYALRANPKVDGLPVLRNRKLPVHDLVRWISSSGVDFDRYEFSFEQHIDPEVAAIFVVTENRIVGEAIQGGILQLNKGLHAVVVLPSSTILASGISRAHRLHCSTSGSARSPICMSRTRRRDDSLSERWDWALLPST
jgi:hypothetical protein